MANLRHGGFFDMAEWIVRINRRMNDLDRIEIPKFCGARYTTNAGQSISNTTTTIINFEDQEYDTHSAVTTGAAWKFTVPATGYYHVSAYCLFSATTTWGEDELTFMQLFKDGVVFTELGRQLGQDTSGQAREKSVGGGTVVYLTASQYIDIRIFQNSGAALTLYNNGAYNYVAIEKVG